MVSCLGCRNNIHGFEKSSYVYCPKVWINKKFGVNLHHHEWGKFLEDMKADILPDGKRNDDHGTIMESGDCYSKNGQYLGNFGYYL